MSLTSIAQQTFVCGNEFHPLDHGNFSPTEDCFTDASPSTVELYKPEANTPVKTIKLKLWVMQKSQIDPQNFSNTITDRDYLKGVIDITNNLLQDVRLPLYGSPIPIGYPNDPSGLTHIPDSRIQLSFDPSTDLEFVIDEQGWNNDGFYNSPYLFNNYVDSEDCVFDFFFINRDQVSGLGLQHYNIHYGTWNDRGELAPGQPITDMQYRHAYNVIHELGHTLGLNHSWTMQFSDLQCNHCAPVAAGCGVTCAITWCKPDQDPLCYSNAMGYAKQSKRNLTPLQIGRMHQLLFRASHTKYLIHEYDPAQDITINGDQTWDLARMVGGNITIPSGAKLTISCKVLMPSDGTITVEKGGTLIVDNGHITITSPRCGGYWGGIYIKGDLSATQSNSLQGVVTLKNDALIEYAHTGVLVEGGGIFKILTAEIKDCYYGTYFQAYEHPTSPLFNSSTIINGTFTLTDDHATAVQLFNSLSKVSGIEFFNCKFSDIRTPATVFPGYFTNFRSKGIQSSNSNFSVTGTLTSFDNLWLGIEAGNNGSIRSFKVEDASFNNCFGGIINRSVNDAITRRNTFIIGGYNTTPITYDNTPAGTNEWDGFGISIQSALDFKLSENVFKALPINPQGDMPNTLGTYIRDLGPGEHEVRNNTFENITFSNYAKGINSSTAFNPSAPGGLQYFCNDNTGDLLDFFYDFYVDDEGSIQRTQGSQSLSAANTFRPGGTTFGYSFRNSPQALQLRYFYYAPNPSEFPISIFNTNRIITQFQNSCFIEDDGFSSKTEKESYHTSFQQSRSQYLYLVNGGAANYQQTQQEQMITEAYQDFQTRGQRLIRAMLHTEEDISETDLINIIRDMGGRTARYGIADWYRENGNFPAAQASLDSLVIDTSEIFLQDEYTDVLALKNLHASVTTDTRDWSNLLPVEVTTLTNLATSGTGIPKAQSRQVLNQFYGDQYLDLPSLGSNTNLREQQNNEEQVRLETKVTETEGNLDNDIPSLALTISPNPASNQVRFDIVWSATTIRYADLIVIDSQGRVVWEQRVFPGQKNIQWHPQHLQGIFLYLFTSTRLN